MQLCSQCQGGIAKRLGEAVAEITKAAGPARTAPTTGPTNPGPTTVDVLRAVKGPTQAQAQAKVATG